MPLFSARIPRQKSSRPRPMQVIGPIPVMTARRLLIRSRDHVSLRFQISLHAMQCLVRDVMDEEIADDRFHDWRKQRDAKLQVVQNFHEHAVRVSV